MKPLHVAFAGFRHSHIFGLYREILNRPDTVFAGGWEPDDEARAEAEKAGVVFPYETEETLLCDPEVDAVAIGAAYGDRGQLVLHALARGKHVLADKPLCTRRSELRAIAEAARKADRAVGIMLDLRCHPNMRTALEIVRGGRIGRVNNIVFEGQHPLMYGQRPAWYFEKGRYGGVLNDIGIHGLDMARLLTDSEISEISAARTWNFYAKDVPHFRDSGQMMLRMESGAGVIGDVSYAAQTAFGYTHSAYWHFRVWGDGGMLDFSAVSDGVLLYGTNGTEPEKLMGARDTRTVTDDFIRAIREDAFRKEYTRDMLAAECAALTVQAAADPSEEGEICRN